MTRDWRKLNRMGSSTSLTDILANPTGIRRVLYDVLTGAQDSSSNAENLWIGTNGRTFHSLGLDTNATYAFTTDPVDHELRLGLRYHYDQIVRAHTEDEFAMVSRQLQSIGTEQMATSNFDSAHAVAGVVQYAPCSNLPIQPGYA